MLFAIKKSQGFSCLCPYDVEVQASWPPPGGGSGKPSKMGTSAELFCNLGLLLGWLIKGVVRIGGILVGSGGQITSSSSQDS